MNHETYLVSAGVDPKSQGEKKPRPADDDDFWYETAPGGMSAAGVYVSAENALCVATVFACVSLIADAVGYLPLIMYRRMRSGDRKRKTDHPLYKLLHDRPNEWQTAFEFKQMLQGHALLRGCAYAEKIFNRRTGDVEALIPKHPDRMKPLRLANGRVAYEWRPINGSPVRYTQDEIFTVRGFTWDGLTALDPISYMRESVGFQIASESYGSKFFRNSARPSGVLKHPKQLSDQAARRLENSFNARYGGDSMGKTAVLEEGMEFQQLGMTHENAQWVESQNLTDDKICSIFRVMPFMIGKTEKVTSWGTGIEQQGIGFVRYTLMPWLVRWQQSVSRDLIIEDEKFFAEFLVEALERADNKTRTEANTQKFLNGHLTLNEWRKQENLAPLDGESGDVHFVPLNLAPVDRVVAGTGGAQAAPPHAEPPPDGDEEETPPPDGDEEETPSPDEPDGENADAKSSLAVREFYPLLRDASARIVNAEIGAVRKRAEKATGDLERFRAWYLAESEAQYSYVVKVLTPLGDAWQMRFPQTYPELVKAADDVQRACRFAILGADDPAKTVEQWQRDETRIGVLAAALAAELERWTK